MASRMHHKIEPILMAIASPDPLAWLKKQFHPVGAIRFERVEIAAGDSLFQWSDRWTVTVGFHGFMFATIEESREAESLFRALAPQHDLVDESKFVIERYSPTDWQHLPK